MMCSFLVDDSNEYKIVKDENKNIVATISQTEFKSVLLNNKYLRHSTNIIQSKNHRMGTYEINKISWSCFDGKVYILNN